MLEERDAEVERHVAVETEEDAEVTKLQVWRATIAGFVYIT